MKLIYDSGPLSVIEHIFALVGAILALGFSLLLASIPFLLFAQAGFQLGMLLVAIFVLSISTLLFFVGVDLLGPVFRRFSMRVYLNGCQIEVRRSFPWKFRDQIFDLSRINTIEVNHPRKGGASIDVLYRFGEEGPSLKASETIGPFYQQTRADAVAAAIQAELLLENFDAKQIVQYKRFNYRIALRMIFVAFIFYELIVGYSLVTSWNQMGIVDRVMCLFMVFFPLLLWYMIRRNSERSGSELPGARENVDSI